MKNFMSDDFLLTTEIAKHLYHDYAKQMPIVDYHCHLSPKEIWEDKNFETITQVWLSGDHYKWRQMRSNGIEERYITGNASEREKFQKWAETLELAIGNPLYHWSHLELQRYFGYKGHLCGDTAEEVWNLCNEKLKRPEYSARGFIQMSNVTLICTTDDPIDTLEYHQKLKADKTFDVKVLPTWRPEQAMSINKPHYLEYLAKLSKVSGIKITCYDSLLEALKLRMEYFQKNGCIISDHSLDYVMYELVSKKEIEHIFEKRLLEEFLTEKEVKQFETAIMLDLAKEYHKKNWTMQLHFGVKRNNNEKIFKSLGPDAGVDAINNATSSSQMADFLNALAKTEKLPKTILYSLNPTDNAVIGTIIGCFQDSSCVGKIQQGSAWWFNDHKQGMIEQMTSLANLGLLGNFIGMLTDSRSFLSYVRHEYFRRILCELIGGWVERGEYPLDDKALEKIVKGICYENVVRYLNN